MKLWTSLAVAATTGEERYRIPFDIFFIAIACAYRMEATWTTLRWRGFRGTDRPFGHFQTKNRVNPRSASA